MKNKINPKKSWKLPRSLTTVSYRLVPGGYGVGAGVDCIVLLPPFRHEPATLKALDDPWRLEVGDSYPAMASSTGLTARPPFVPSGLRPRRRKETGFFVKETAFCYMEKMISLGSEALLDNNITVAKRNAENIEKYILYWQISKKCRKYSDLEDLCFGVSKVSKVLKVGIVRQHLDFPDDSIWSPGSSTYLGLGTALDLLR